MTGRSLNDISIQTSRLARLIPAPSSADTASKAGETKWTARQRTIVFAVIQIALIWAIAGAIVWLSHDDAVKRGRAAALSSSLTVSAYTRQALNSADLVLRSFQDWVTEAGVQSEDQFRRTLSGPRFSWALRDRILGSPQINAAVIAAINGDVVNASLVSENAPANIADRGAFRTQVAEDAPPFTLTALARNPRGQWTFYMSRRLVATSGALLGVAIVGIDAEYLSNLFRQVSPGGDEAVTLFREDGALLATTVRKPELFGGRYPDAIPLRMMRQGLDGAVQRTSEAKWSDPTSHEPRLVAPRLVEGFPVLVAVSISRSVYLGGWQDEIILASAIALLLTGLTIFLVLRYLRFLSASEAAGQLAVERRFLASLIDTPSAICAVLDRTGEVVYSNRRFKEEIVARTSSPRIFDDPALRGGDEVMRFTMSDDPNPIGVDLKLEQGDGTVHFLRLSLSRQRLPGRGACTVIVGHDETARYAVQQNILQSAKLATLGELTTGMAHELAQPLNVMRMAAQNALIEIASEDPQHDGPASGETQMSEAEVRAFIVTKLNRIVSQIDRAADIVSRMRIFGRAPKGPPSEFDARDACRSAIALVDARAKGAGVNIITELGDEPLNLRGYQNLLEIVLVNLLLNAKDALEASTRPSKTIDVAARRTSDGKVCLTVADNGPGIPLDIRDRIFEPFFTGKPTGKGTGLGLATSFGIVRDAGGQLSLLPGTNGAIFQVELPAAA